VSCCCVGDEVMSKGRPPQRNQKSSQKGGQKGSQRSDQKGGQNSGQPGKGNRSSQGGKSTGHKSRNRGGGGPPQRSRAQKLGLGGDQVEGRHAVRELLLGGSRRVREIMIIDDMDNADILDDISELAFEMKVPLKALPRRRFETEALTESHQGVIARAAPLPETPLEDLAAKRGAHLLVLDGVTDPGNLGAILRTAECAGVTGVVLSKHRSVHISPTVTKTAAGAVEYLPMAVVGGIPTAIARLNDLGVLTVGLDMGGDTSIFELPLDKDQPVALVLGAEGKGLSRLVRERVSVLSSIPMRGRLNSLNVAMAGAVGMFEVVRRREAAG